MRGRPLLWTCAKVTPRRVARPAPPGAARAKGTRLSSASWGLMVGGDGVDGAVVEGGGDGSAVGLGAERGGELGVAAEVADGGLVEVEIGGGRCRR